MSPVTRHNAMRRYGVEASSTGKPSPCANPTPSAKHGNSITSVKGLRIDQYSIQEVGRHVLAGGGWGSTTGRMHTSACDPHVTNKTAAFFLKALATAAEDNVAPLQFAQPWSCREMLRRVVDLPSFSLVSCIPSSRTKTRATRVLETKSKCIPYWVNFN